MPIAIKTRNFSLDKDKMEGEFTERADGLGWGPGYGKRFKGSGTNTQSKKFQENFDKIDWSKT